MRATNLKFAQRYRKQQVFTNFSFSTSIRSPVILSPIFYVNAQPHIGHLYTAILCDAVTRYKLCILMV